LVKSPKECSGVNVNSDFGLSVTDMTLDELTRAYQAGLLSRETIWNEMKRRGLLSDEFDADEEKDLLMTAARDGTFQSPATRFLVPGRTPGATDQTAGAPQPDQREAA
jgi:hypothetical protein